MVVFCCFSGAAAVDQMLFKAYNLILIMPKKTKNPIPACPVCFSDRLEIISIRMNKCESCGFIWNHEVSDRDNLMLIVEHQSKLANDR